MTTERVVGHFAGRRYELTKAYASGTRRLVRRRDWRRTCGWQEVSHMTMDRIEVITSVERRRRWSRAEKARLVAAPEELGAVVTEIARALSRQR